MNTPTTLSILGVTGTIGQNCLQVLEANAGQFQVEAVTANENAEALAIAAKRCGASFAAIGNPDKYAELKTLTAGMDIEIAAGEDAIVEAAARPSDTLVAGIVGAAGLKPTLAGVERGARIALANKECLVCAGELFMQAVKKHGATLIPVDSEHNAIFQILHSAGSRDITDITLTASGGPFWQLTREQMQDVTPAQAVKHPNWSMGAKISVDSATMMNKGLELIEAMHLFGLPPEKLKAIIHPESIIHGLVSYSDGSVLAQLSQPDMRIPLAYALGFPKRLASGVPPLNLAQIGSLHFEEPDTSKFPAIALAYQAMKQGGSAPTALNAANEVAVQAFLDKRLKFNEITNIVNNLLTNVNCHAITTITDALEVDMEVRRKITTMI